MVLDLPTGKTKPVSYGGVFIGRVKVIRTGKYRGFLIGAQPTLLHDVHTTVYWLLDPDGKQVARVGETESDLSRFEHANGVR